LHDEMDAEGRVISAVVGGVRFVSVYLPSGSSGEERQGFKERVLGDYQSWVSALIADGVPVVLGGDYNVAHREIDLKNWRGNQKNSGFLPQERAWMTAHLESGLVDTHRAHLGDAAEYTWWSNRGGAYDNNVGWRIDYLLAAGVELREVTVDRAARLSDHAPLSGVVTVV
uniref:exodeoxyribonuclease III n=1 Tax=Deinococcus sp. TaxID=47478 RepID=UPI002869C090